MKPLQYRCGKLLTLVIAGSLAASATIQAGASGSSAGLSNDAAYRNNARLTVRRAADFGISIYLSLFIDGIQVTNLGYNERYEAIVRPGRHVFSVGTSPSPYGHTKYTHRRILIKPGQTYAFTALWQGADDAVLESSDVYRARMVW
jgi:hypothetical protein